MKLFEVTWVAQGCPTWQTEYIQASTKMEVKSTIRWRELDKGVTVKEFKEIKEVQEVA